MMVSKCGEKPFMTRNKKKNTYIANLTNSELKRYLTYCLSIEGSYEDSRRSIE